MTVECATCHRGRAKPEMIQDVLLTLYRDEGMEKALTEYRTLRDKYYGDYAFDFSHKALNQLAQNLAIESDFDAASIFVDLNLEFNPRSVRAYQLQGDIWKEKGDLAAVRISYEKGLEIQPDNSFMQSLIDRLDTAP
jgi:lipopolysaccharide biosynthesis regulator YciM